MDSEAKKHTQFLLALVMTPMKPLTQGTPGLEVIEGHEACDRAFALACHYSGGHDLVEEMVASKYWLLGRNRTTIRIKWSACHFLVMGLVSYFLISM